MGAALIASVPVAIAYNLFLDRFHQRHHGRRRQITGAMMFRARGLWSAALLCATMLAWPAPASPPKAPAWPIKLVVPFPAGDHPLARVGTSTGNLTVETVSHWTASPQSVGMLRNDVVDHRP
jgi:hypothetical protein